MASIQTIVESPYYFGEISLDEVKNILFKEPPQSYLFRRLKNGNVTLATIVHHLKSNVKFVFELEIKNCNCEGALLPIQKFKSLDDFISFCNFVCPFESIESYNGVKFIKPISRKNALSLEEMAKFCIKRHYSNSIDQLNLPKILKENLENHNHVEITIDEIKALEDRPTFV